MDWRKWGIGLLSALLSGVGNAVAVYLVVPESLSWERLGLVALFGAIIGVANYIKQFPLPVKTTVSAILFFLTIMVSIAGASPFLVCDPYPTTALQPTHFVIQEYQDANRTIPIGGEIVSAGYALQDGSIILHEDLANVSYGVHYITVKAVVVDAWGGRSAESASVPFTYQRANPSIPSQGGLQAPSRIRLSKE